MIQANRRGFITGLFSVGALVAAPAVIRVAPLMPISTRWTPAYVPIDWLARRYGMERFPLGGQDGPLSEEWLAMRAKGMELLGLDDLKKHAWSRPMADNWIDINDHDPAYVRAQLQAFAEDYADWFRGYT